MTEENPNYLAGILEPLCAEAGAALFFEPVFRRAGRIRFANGKTVFFKGTSLDINGQSAAWITRDKTYAAQFLSAERVRVPEGVLCYSPRFTRGLARKNSGLARKLHLFSPALDFAAKHGFPLIVKPNEGAEGEGVARVDCTEALCAHISHLAEVHARILVQRLYQGQDYRVVVLDGEVKIAYHRMPLGVTGDGTNTAAALMQARVAEIRASGISPSLVADEAAVARFLGLSGRSLADIPGQGEFWPLLPNANLSTGGSLRDVSADICPEYAAIACRAATALGLRLAGVDIFCADIARFDPAYIVLEVNAAPGLHHFGRSGAGAHRKVVALYRQLLARLAQDRGGTL